MMEQALRTLIKGLVSAAPVDWGMNEQSATVPRVVLTLVSGGQGFTQTGPNGLRQYRVQVDCYGATYSAAMGLARLVIAGLSGYRAGDFAGIFLDAERDFQPDTETGAVLFRRSIDFIINHKEA